MEILPGRSSRTNLPLLTTDQRQHDRQRLRRQDSSCHDAATTVSPPGSKRWSMDAEATPPIAMATDSQTKGRGAAGEAPQADLDQEGMSHPPNVVAHRSPSTTANALT